MTPHTRVRCTVRNGDATHTHESGVLYVTVTPHTRVGCTVRDERRHENRIRRSVRNLRHTEKSCSANIQQVRNEMTSPLSGRIKPLDDANLINVTYDGYATRLRYKL